VSDHPKSSAAHGVMVDRALAARPPARVRRCAGALATVAAGWWLGACGDAPAPEPPPPTADSAPRVVVPLDSPPPLTPSTWDPALGALLLLPVPTDAPSADGRTLVLSPLLPLEADGSDTTGVRERIGRTAFSLFDRSGARGDAWLDGASLAPAVDDAGCASWPRGVLRPAGDSASGVAVMPSWLVALPAGRASAVSFDSIEALPTRDSATLAAGLARLASSVAEDSGSVFRGLPMTVVRAYRTRDVAPTIVVADLVRRVPQEDQPLAEHLVLVVEQPSAAVGTWRVAWFERLAGHEEEIATVAPLALLRVGPTGRLSLLLGLESGTMPDVRLLERGAARWTERWRAVLPEC
jgi:hypothetical protein